MEINRSKKNIFSNIGISKDKNYFIENLSVLVASGMPVLNAIDSIISEIRSKRLKKYLNIIKEDIESGYPIWRALKESELFNDHTISLIKLGEESGNLVENLKVIATEEEKDRSFRSKIRSAMMYPVFVLSITLIVGIGIAWFILPKLANVFSELRLELPLITKILINGGTYLNAYGVYVIPAFAAFIILFFYILFFNRKTKSWGQSILMLVPGVGKLIKEVEIARFGYLLGTLLKAGLSVTEAFESLRDATDFPRYKKFYEHMMISIEEGNSFQRSFSTYKNLRRIIPVSVQQLIISGEQSGNLSGTLVKIGENFESKADTTTKNLTIILEPILLVLVWIGVVGVALAVILPIYSLVGGLQY